MVSGVCGVTGPTVQPRVVTVHSHEIEPVQTRFLNMAVEIARAIKHNIKDVYGKNVQVSFYHLFDIFFRNEICRFITFWNILVNFKTIIQILLHNVIFAQL